MALSRLPVIQLVTDVATVPERELLAGLDRAASLAERARFELSVQLRDPALPVRELLRLGEILRRKTLAIGARLVVNDRVDVALLLGADGVHLGRRSVAPADARALLGEGAWVSTSAHSIADVVAAARAGATATLLSPLFASPGKGPPLGARALTEARATLRGEGLSTLVLALGGVDHDNAAACLEAGADGLAFIRADPSALVQAAALARRP